MKFALKIATAAVIAATATGALAQKGETVKIAWIDPLSGLMAAVGTNQLKSFQFFAEEFNKKNAGRREVRDHRHRQQARPQETTSALKLGHSTRASRYIVQGNGSGPALALIDAINKYNERNPGKEVLYLNYAAVDPDLTNSKCSYWHFRFDADTTMKMEALTTFMKDQKDIKKVYLLQPELLARPAGRQVRQGRPEAQAPRHRDRRRRPASARAGARLRALHRQDQGLGRRHRDHRQLGLRPGAAGQGRERGAATTASSTPTTPASPARRPRWARAATARSTRSPTATTTWAATCDK